MVVSKCRTMDASSFFSASLYLLTYSFLSFFLFFFFGSFSLFYNEPEVFFRGKGEALLSVCINFCF